MTIFLRRRTAKEAIELASVASTQLEFPLLAIVRLKEGGFIVAFGKGTIGELASTLRRDGIHGSGTDAGDLLAALSEAA